MRDLSRRSLLTIPSAVGLAIILSAAPVAAVTWVKTTLADTAGLSLSDAAFDGHNVAVVWQEPGRVTKLRTSTNDGSSFGTTRTTEGSTREAATVLCGSDLYVAYARDWSSMSTPNLWLIDVDVRTTSGAEVVFTAAWPDQDVIGRNPDVACAGGELFVSWLQKVGSAWHVYVNYAPRSSPMFPFDPIDLGVAHSSADKPVVAGVGNRAYVAWSTPTNTIRIHRWSVAATTVSDLGEQQLRSGESVGYPKIAALGGKVAVVWTDCGDVRARVSNDRGATWGTVKTIFTGVCDSEFGGFPLSIAINGPRILVSYIWGGESPPNQAMIATRNDFASFSDNSAYATNDLFLLGFVHPSGTTRIAGAVDEGTRLRYLRQP